MVEVRFHSLGGQGAVTLINMLAQAGDLVGRNVQAFPFFGAERRGAPVMCFLRMDDKPIDLRSQIYRPDFLVVMSTYRDGRGHRRRHQGEHGASWST